MRKHNSILLKFDGVTFRKLRRIKNKSGLTWEEFMIHSAEVVEELNK